MNPISIFLRTVRKGFLFAILIIIYVAICIFWRVWTRNVVRRRQHLIQTVSKVSRLSLKILNIHVKVIRPPSLEKNYLLVGNHLGFLDIFVLSSICPSLFITSVEMKKSPGLGFLTEMAGCLYVERRNRSQIRQDIEQIRKVLEQKFNVALYPEGTSSNGEKLLPFKKAMLASAVGTNTPVLPMVINYRQVNSEPMSARWRDYVCWYGEQTFVEAAKRILAMQSANVELEFLEETKLTAETDLKPWIENLRQQISEKYSPILR